MSKIEIFASYFAGGIEWSDTSRADFIPIASQGNVCVKKTSPAAGFFLGTPERLKAFAIA
jgi:hypothetical protein